MPNTWMRAEAACLRHSGLLWLYWAIKATSRWDWQDVSSEQFVTVSSNASFTDAGLRERFKKYVVVYGSGWARKWVGPAFRRDGIRK
ncbi:hypothetical protein AB9P05_03765 [Roseivirga sp. BDSF3-8]|uniref:hypothetical protein n=1 Tax=Roseivirga sp. BDSF3-8 TaxID=3241598 RepID=UPI0035319EC9